MLYGLAFLILFIIILLVWLIRVIAATNERRKQRKRSSGLPSQIQDLSHRPTLGETAGDVVDRIRQHRPGATGPYIAYQNRYERSDVVGVNRVANINASVTSLPAYGADTPRVPAAAYDPSRPRSGEVSSGLPTYSEVPPKYTASINQPRVAV